MLQEFVQEVVQLKIRAGAEYEGDGQIYLILLRKYMKTGCCSSGTGRIK